MTPRADETAPLTLVAPVPLEDIVLRDGPIPDDRCWVDHALRALGFLFGMGLAVAGFVVIVAGGVWVVWAFFVAVVVTLAGLMPWQITVTVAVLIAVTFALHYFTKGDE